MAMTYSSLIAAKGNAGSIANFLSYTKVQSEVPTILDEAQALIYTLLRTREMKARTRFLMTVGAAWQPLPTNFLDPIGQVWIADWNLQAEHFDESYVQRQRIYTPSSGSQTPSAPNITYSAGSPLITINFPAHGFNQDSVIAVSGATNFDVVTINGTWDIYSIVDANNFVIDITPLGTVPAASGTFQTSFNYQADGLIQASPKYWSIAQERIFFDCAFDIQVMCELYYYQSLPLLSNTNQSNFLTNRYPQLIRPACQAQAAAFMRDDQSYQREVGRLTAIADRINVADDMHNRGMVLESYNP